MENKNNELAEAVQIITRVDHKLELQVDTLETILKSDELKDHEIVVVSIVGAFRKGKSFLMNFFLKYLYAQYKRHNVNDWIGENSNDSELHGFKWRGGQKPETFGIWMWSEMFTHEFDDGRKVAIILLDTQGIFDHESSLKDCIATFSISMMISSVQCFNVMQNVQEDDLQHLDLFTEYSRLVIEKTQEKPFQNLVFVIRDWSYPYETAYGYSQEFVEKLFNKNDKQTEDMRQLREQIRSSFENINAFLLPHPGLTVAQKQDFTGNLKDINTDFVEYVKELVPTIFAPENLVVKKINGEKVRARDLVASLQSYVSAFKGDEIPEPKSIVMATAEAQIQILYKNCLDFFMDTMQKGIKEKSHIEYEPYLNSSEFKRIFHTAEKNCMRQFKKTRKLGGFELSKSFQRKLEDDIKGKYKIFGQENNKKIRDFEDSIQIFHKKCLSIYVDSMDRALKDASSYLEESELDQTHVHAMEKSLSEFDQKWRRNYSTQISTWKGNLQCEIQSEKGRFENQNEQEKISTRKTKGIILGSVTGGLGALGLIVAMVATGPIGLGLGLGAALLSSTAAAGVSAGAGAGIAAGVNAALPRSLFTENNEENATAEEVTETVSTKNIETES